MRRCFEFYPMVLSATPPPRFEVAMYTSLSKKVKPHFGPMSPKDPGRRGRPRCDPESSMFPRLSPSLIVPWIVTLPTTASTNYIPSDFFLGSTRLEARGLPSKIVPGDAISISTDHTNTPIILRMRFTNAPFLRMMKFHCNIKTTSLTCLSHSPI